MSPTLSNIIEQLASPVVGYYQDAIISAEPTALATLLLLAVGENDKAKAGLAWLREAQRQNGAVTVTAEAESPCWPTSLALLTFMHAGRAGCDHAGYRDAAAAAEAWILNHQGEPIHMAPEQRGALFGHDTTLVAWPWVMGTHSWMEPTCLHVIALHAAGQGEHKRTVEARKLLRNRLLPSGGCNYGNTLVLGQMLRPHLQPSGMTATALSVERSEDGRPALSEATLNYLTTESVTTRAAVSLAWASLGLAANGREFPVERLEDTVRRNLERERSPYRLALLGHALLGSRSPLVPQSLKNAKVAPAIEAVSP